MQVFVYGHFKLPAIRQLSNIESLTIAGNGRFWAGNEIHRDVLEWRNLLWCLYVVPPPQGIFVYCLRCITVSPTKVPNYMWCSMHDRI